MGLVLFFYSHNYYNYIIARLGTLGWFYNLGGVTQVSGAMGWLIDNTHSLDC